MAKLTAALLVCFAAFVGSAEAQQQDRLMMTRAPCAPFADMIKTATKYGEQPLFIGSSGSTFDARSGREYVGGMFFLVNQESEKRSWTMFQIFEDGMACMLFNGYGFQPYSGDEIK